jgi:hypothetical protein
MKKRKKTLMEQAAAPTLPHSEETAGLVAAEVETTTTNAGADQREEQWQGCCRLAFNLSRRGEELAQYQAKLENGHRVPFVDDARLMSTALALVSGMAAAGVRKWGWLPAPSTEDLADPASWVTRRLAQRRSEQNDAERDRRLRQKEARAFGQRGLTGNGTINPVHEQRSKHSLEELARRLEFVMAKHQADHGEFKREWLDHRSNFYIHDCDGGISNKQVAIMACEITGSRSRRAFDENWKIVTDYLRERQVEKPSPSETV